mgnify:CR=1 FL=1|jgi:hypothetical protein
MQLITKKVWVIRLWSEADLEAARSNVRCVPVADARLARYKRLLLGSPANF